MKVNIKQLTISILGLALIIISACSYDDGIEPSGSNDFGYLSRYTGNFYHAVFQSYDNSKEIGRELIKAINYGNKIYKNSVNMIIPELITDNNTFGYIEEQGDCSNNKGSRKYRVKPFSNINKDNDTLYSDVIFNAYCQKNALNPTIQEVIIKNSGNLEENYTLQNNIEERLYTFLSDNLSININNNNLWDNNTINGLIKRKSTKNYDSGTQNSGSTQVSMDMPYNETNFRFDIYANELPENKKYIKFYHYKYGYVTADISFLGENEILSPNDKITMVFQDDKKCIFSQEDLDSKNFNCGDY